MSIRNFDFFEVFMKKIWISLISALYCGFTLGYMHFANPRTNAGALSTIGLDHPVLFDIMRIFRGSPWNIEQGTVPCSKS